MENISGLSEIQVADLQKTFGFNELPIKRHSAFKRLLKRMWSPIPWMIEIAAVLSMILGRWDDFIIISILLFVNVFIDYKQESKALDALEILREKLAKKAIVLRDGEFKEIDARFLVPGDIIKLKIGDIVPADAKLIQGKYLQIDQSTLTGESLPINKIIGDKIYSNSVVKIGEMLAEVLSIGEKTYFGKNTTLIEKAQASQQSHFQKAIIRIGDFLILFSAMLAVLIIVVAFFRHDNFFEVLQFVLVLAVASIPVALPAVLSVTMAVGAVSISKFKAIVSDLSAIEELAGIDVLCIDKTGTLTQNRMSVGQPIIYSKFKEKDLFIYAALASSRENKDPIETPIFEYLNKHHFDNDIYSFVEEEFIPFDPITKRTEVSFSGKNKNLLVSKGAPQVIISMCDNEAVREKAMEDVYNLAKEGYRTLAVAIKDKKRGGFKLVGLIPLFDPPRKESSLVIKKVREGGVDVKMLTGDNHAIATQIADLLDIGLNIVDISKLKTDGVSDEFATLSSIIAQGLYKKLKLTASKEEAKDFGEKISEKVKEELGSNGLPDGFIKKHKDDIVRFIENSNGFSQVMPEDKYFIIEQLQKAGHIVAMTGDGVNDAPALSKADIGIAVSGATDAARAAADLILLSPGLSVINHAIRIASQTFERMKGYAIFRIAETMRIILFMALSIIFFDSYPITATMIIVLALLNDIPVMMIAYDNAPGNNKPVRWDMKEVLTVATVLGLAGVVSSFILFYWLNLQGYSILLIQSLLFIKLDVAGHSTLYLTRTGRNHFWHRPYPSLKFFLPAFSSRIIGTLIAVYGVFMIPIGWKYAGIMWLYATAWWLFNDFLKVYTYKIIDKNKKKSPV
ncbi:MAG: plasma-membrane proton-efflux P-type ATPase [Patescibacteria group bacterium]|jgi:H+-transporting ATPase|nr:plasma-membrane proton-efflux P-type ATPase [Patescibacteria group bacterium]